MNRSTPPTRRTPDPGKSILVTGGGGYIGSMLCRHVIAAGHRLTVWGRRRPVTVAPNLYRFSSYDLAQPLPEGGLEGVDVVIHLAHDMTDTEQLQINEKATTVLRDAVREAPPTVLIFISSQSAHADAPSPYGRIKWRVEQILDGARETSVRPGFVYGGAAGGAFGALLGLLQKTPVMPLVGAKAELQPVHVDDLCAALMRIAEADRRSSIYRIAAPAPVTFAGFVRQLARHRLGRRLWVLPVPLGLALLGARLCRLVPGLPHIADDRITGLTRIRPMDTADDLRRLGLTLRDLVAGLQERRQPSRRPLIREGRALLHYINGRPPACAWVRRYVRAVLASGNDRALDLPGWALSVPGLIRLLEPPPGRAADGLRRRLDMAVAIVETTPQGAALFAAYEPPSRFATLLALVGTLAVELLLLPLRMLKR